MVLRGVLKFLVGAVIAFLLVLAVFLAGGYFAAKSFDPNFFRTELEKQLTQQTGMRVELGNIKLLWRTGPCIQLDGLKFYNPVNLEKLLQGDSVVMESDLASLWRKRIWVPSVLIQNPEVFIKRRSNGFWNWQAVDGPLPVREPAPGQPPGSAALVPAASKAESVPATGLFQGAAPEKKTANASPWAFGLGRIEIRDGTVHYVDETVQPAYTLQVVNCEAEIRPGDSLSAFHGVLSGTVWQASEKKVRLTGDLDISARTLDFQFRYDGDRAGLDGTLKLINNVPRFDGALKLRGLDLESLVPQDRRSGEHLAGALSADLRLSFDGGNPELLLRSLNTAGTVGIANGSVRNRNLIREVLQKMSPVVAVAGALGGEMPPQITELTKRPDTEFRKASVGFSASQGTLNIQDFAFEHPEYLLSGRGIYGLLNRQIDLTASLRFSEAISAYFVQKIHEMETLCDRNGRLVIPFRYAGVVPDAVATPDLPYIGSRVLQAGAEKMVEKGIKQLSEVLEPRTKEN